MALTSPRTNSQIKALGVYQVAGGIIGIGMTFLLIDFNSLSGLFVMLLLLLITALYSYSIYCGIMLFRNIKNGLYHSRINQLLQIISFTIYGYAFQYASGLRFRIGLDLSRSFEFIFDIGISSWKLSFNGGDNELSINFNFVAFFLVLFIEKTIRKIKESDIKEQVSALGQRD